MRRAVGKDFRAGLVAGASGRTARGRPRASARTTTFAGESAKPSKARPPRVLHARRLVSTSWPPPCCFGRRPDVRIPSWDEDT